MNGQLKITEIQRWEYRPGDRLIAHVDRDAISREQAIEVAGRLRTILHLPDDAPIAIAGRGWTFEVVSETDLWPGRNGCEDHHLRVEG